MQQRLEKGLGRAALLHDQVQCQEGIIAGVAAANAVLR